MAQYLTVDDVARQLRVSRRTIERWIQREGLPAVKVGRLVRVDPDALADWVKARTARRDQLHG